jgi:TATA-binding protein-associated factor
MVVPSLPRDWVDTPFLSLLFQNLVCEERSDIRDLSLSAWRTALSILGDSPGRMENVVTQQLILDWYATMMTPLGVAVDSSAFYNPSAPANGAVLAERHNVDKNMLSQDMSLISVEVTLKARVATATALAYLMIYWPKEVNLFFTPTLINKLFILSWQNPVEQSFGPILLHYVDSTSMLQKFLTAIIAEEWARKYDALPDKPPLTEVCVLAQELTAKTLAWLQGKPPPAYHEMAFSLSRIHADCISLLQMFATECKLPMSSIPFLGTEIDISGTRPKCFTIETAQTAMGSIYSRLKDSLGRTRKKELAVINEKRSLILSSIEHYNDLKTQHDIRVSASFAAAFVAFKSTPDKVSPVVKGIMNGIKVRIFALIHDNCLICLRTKKTWICKIVQLSPSLHL